VYFWWYLFIQMLMMAWVLGSVRITSRFLYMKPYFSVLHQMPFNFFPISQPQVYVLFIKMITLLIVFFGFLFSASLCVFHAWLLVHNMTTL
jgi:hypothetical protein